MTPKISVILSNYNRANLLKRSIESVLSQTFEDFELIIIEDGSTDNSLEIIEQFAMKDNRIRWISFKENSGLPARRYNQGISLAKADLIAFAFNDDEFYEHHLQTLYDFMLINNECGFIYGQADYYDLKNNTVRKDFGGDWDYKKILNYNFLCNMSVLVKKEAINLVGGLDEIPLLKREVTDCPVCAT